jgi:hypothetical protein
MVQAYCRPFLGLRLTELIFSKHWQERNFLIISKARTSLEHQAGFSESLERLVESVTIWVNLEWDASVSSVLRGSFNQESGAFRDSAFLAVYYVRQVNLLGTFPGISRTENFSFTGDQVVSLTGVSLSAVDQGHSRKR